MRGWFGAGKQAEPAAGFDPDEAGGVASEKSFDPDGGRARRAPRPDAEVVARLRKLAMRAAAAPHSRSTACRSARTEALQRIAARGVCAAPQRCAAPPRRACSDADLVTVLLRIPSRAATGDLDGVASEKSFDPDSAGFVGDASLSEKSYDPDAAGFLGWVCDGVGGVVSCVCICVRVRAVGVRACGRSLEPSTRASGVTRATGALRVPLEVLPSARRLGTRDRVEQVHQTPPPLEFPATAAWDTAQAKADRKPPTNDAQERGGFGR